MVAIVPAYQPGPNLSELVAALAAQTDRVVVVDDASPTPVEASTIRHEANRGIAAALNTGIRSALADDPVAVVTVDQDSTVPDGYVDALVDAWERAERSGHRVGLVAPEHVTGLPDQRAGRPPVQSGLLIPTATIRQIDDFDEQLFVDGVDDDYALRCLDAGLALVVASGVALGHRLGDTYDVTVAGRTLTLTRSAPFRYYYLTRNRLWLVRRHARRHPGWAAGQAFGLLRHLAVVQTFAPGRGARASNVRQGIRDGLRQA